MLCSQSTFVKASNELSNQIRFIFNVLCVSMIAVIWVDVLCWNLKNPYFKMVGIKIVLFNPYQSIQRTILFSSLKILLFSVSWLIFGRYSGRRLTLLNWLANILSSYISSVWNIYNIIDKLSKLFWFVKSSMSEIWQTFTNTY